MGLDKIQGFFLQDIVAIYELCAYIFPACMNMQHLHAMFTGQKTLSDSLELHFRATVNGQVDARN